MSITDEHMTQDVMANWKDSPAPGMVRFGPEAHQSVHLETAERMLTGLAARSPKLFRELYGAAVLGDK